MSGLRAACFALAGLAVAPAPASAQAVEHPGHVDGARFAALASEDGQLVQVSLTGPLLALLSGAMAEEEPELAATIAGLVSVQAVVVSVEGSRAEAARQEVGRLEKRLVGSGWTAIARVREESSEVAVFALVRGEAVEGLTVTVLDRGEGQLVFTNVAGRIDMARLEGLTRRLDLPGLDQIPERRSGPPRE